MFVTTQYCCWSFSKMLKTFCLILERDCVRLLINVLHPADVHLFKHLIWLFEKRGHDVKITARNKDCCKTLLDLYGFEYELISNAGNGISGLGFEMISRTKKFVSIIKRYDPDLVLSMMDPSSAIASKVCGKKYISLEDTEHSKLVINLTLPFTDVVLTPSCFKKKLGLKQIRYEGYHELAYLHPNFFQPNPNVLSELGLTESDPYIVLRFVSWGAIHDVGQHGISNKKDLVKMLEKYGKVFITSEGEIDIELEKYKLKLSSEKLHDLLYYATLYIGEGATTASECALLGTHAIYVNTLRLGYLNEEEDKYDLVYNFSTRFDIEKKVYDKALELLKNPNLKQEGKIKRENIIKDKIDVTKFMVQFVEQYK
ncbi:DUF354 domain-containing protein [Methanosarcina vacuolata]|uniref:DUF354 domain-containing protein n=1 Tax=Methanosarcina vacuolata Z-761 TaxID=1434123 RepID=A0A0E3Q693_9EURY|nr:DUF354 domain-containing protein [Methanosarcina vacuolata]AKB45089.1 hypothetical protein MSVAZ_2820 [Methanosarcina vacuolata Z-761]